MDKIIKQLEQQSPLISVLMPVYNGEVFLKEAIESILNQSYSHFELLLINDGSTDNSESIIKSFSDERLVYIKNEKNLGLIATLNKGLELCKGSFIARMDQDDISLPQRFQKQIQFLIENPLVAVVSTKLKMVNETGKDLGYWNDDFEANSSEDILNTMPKLNCIGHPTAMMRGDVVKKYKYNSKFKGSEDWGLWLTLLSNNYKIDKIDEVLLKYRIHASGTTVNANSHNVSKRIIKFKRRYLWDKFKKAEIKKYDKKVFRYLLIDILKYYFPFVYSFLIKWAETKFNKLITQQRLFNKVCNNFSSQHSALFFYPFYHLGGAEVVHSDIVKAVTFTQPIVLFTSASGTSTLLSDFKKSAIVLEIDQLLIWPFIRKNTSNKIIQACNKHVELKLFSSNSKYYYDLLKHIPEHTKAFDLIHAFMHKHEDSAEKWSLPFVNNLAARVVINKKTSTDFEEQYTENKIDKSFLNRIIYISNFVENKPISNKNFDGNLKLLFVGRGSTEKRVHLLARAAKQLNEKKVGIEFHFAGNVANAIPNEFKKYIILHGEISDKNKLAELYSSCHILAMASTREGFPMVIMEAMMQGTVPVSTNVGGISEHILNNENGFLIHEIEAEYFINKFVETIEFLNSNRDKLKTISNNAYAYATQNFNQEKFTQSYVKLFSNG